MRGNQASRYYVRRARAFCINTASADEILKFRSVYHVTALQAQGISDVNRRAMSLVRSSGLAPFPGGSVGADHAVAGTDYIKGSGPFAAYGDLTRIDGWLL